MVSKDRNTIFTKSELSTTVRFQDITLKIHLEKLFSLRNFASVANQKQNLLRKLMSKKCFVTALFLKQSIGLEL